MISIFAIADTSAVRPLKKKLCSND